MYQLLLVTHLITAVLLIGVVLLQQGKGAQAGAAFGSGASQTVFGSQGSGGFLSRATGVLATLFFLLSLALAYMVNKQTYLQRQRAMPVEQTETAPPMAEPNPNAGDVPVVD